MRRCYWDIKDNCNKCHCGWVGSKPTPEFLKLYNQIWSNDPLNGTIKMSYLPQAQQARLKALTTDTLTLCLNRDALNHQGVLNDAVGVYPFKLEFAQPNDTVFLGRKVVDQLGMNPIADAKLYASSASLAIEYPQILGYIVVRCGDEILTYARKLTDEQRLLGKCSIGFGGHIDPEDSCFTMESDTEEYINLRATVRRSVERELSEELGIAIDALAKIGKLVDSQEVVIDTRPSTEGNGSVAVGQVHVGVVFEYFVEDKSLISTNLECQDPRWQSLSALKDDIKMYESWSQLLITHLCEQEESFKAKETLHDEDEHEDEGAPDDDMIEDDETVGVKDNANPVYTNAQWEDDKPF